jgi:hypothetical protein
MKAVMQELAQARLHYSKMPLFDFLRRETTPARDRLAFYPCMAPFVLAFSDHHQRQWYLDDFVKLGFDHAASVTSTLRKYLSDDARQGRKLAARLTQMIQDATSAEKRVIVHAIGEANAVFFEHTRVIAAQIRAGGGPELCYLGQSPVGREALGESAELTPLEHVRCLDFAFRVYDMYADWTIELLTFANNALTHRTVPHVRAMVGA